MNVKIRNQILPDDGHYIGLLVWNKQRYDTGPKTGDRVPRPNPRDEWIVEHVPNHRIIEDGLWEAAQARLQAMRAAVLSAPNDLDDDDAPYHEEKTATGVLLGRAHRPVWPLAGLVKCGVCHGSITVISKGRLGCANQLERGICSNNRTVLRDKLQGQVFDGLKQRLLAPELVEQFVNTYAQEVNAANQERGPRTPSCILSRRASPGRSKPCWTQSRKSAAAVAWLTTCSL